MKNTILFLLLILLAFQTKAQQVQPVQEEPKSLVKWLTFKEAFEQNKKIQKPFIVDVYTSWCIWCKHMMQTTFSNPSLAEYINANFYPVHFNAETMDTIEYLGKKYINAGSGNRSANQLALKLLNGKLSYPTILFLNGYQEDNFKFSLIAPGYLDVKKIEPLLVFTLENVFNTTPYEVFNKYWETAFNDSIKKEDKVNWQSFNEVMELYKKNPKKILVNFSTKWCNSCKVQNKATFTNPVIADYINKNFYAIDFPADSKDTVYFNTYKFYNVGQLNNPFHQFTLAALQNKVILPSIVIINEKYEVINSIPYYMPPETLDGVLHYFGDNVYSKTPWPDFQKEFKTTITTQ